MYPNIHHNIKKGRCIWNKLNRGELQEKETSIGKVNKEILKM
jgi:hypothetical protein